jgi:GEVED domain/FG-GAP-like repeat
MRLDLWREEIRRLFGSRQLRGGLANTGTARGSFRWRVRPRLEALEARMVLASDFGDAPLPFATLLAEDGARHEDTGPLLGNFRDTEADGLHATNADADDTAGLPDDEDGISFGLIRAGQLGASVTVTVAGAPSGARLDAWIDFNRDGSWGGPLEQIAHGASVVDGNNTLSFDVPSTALEGTSIGRFRLSTAGNLGVRGEASDGEVEDHAVTILPPIVASGVFGIQNTIFSNGLGGARSVFAADVDGDGDNDVLSASSTGDTIAWHENDGSQGFTTWTIANDARGARSVHAADVDGDGDTDVLSASANNGTIAWYENDGRQNFTQRIISTAASGAASVFAADVDGDGDADILSASSLGDKIAWYENDGSQNFAERIISSSVDGALSVFAADVDGDGDTDVLSAGGGANTIAWYENDGSQNFITHTISAASAQSIFATDVDGDGDTDVLTVGANLLWYENNGNQNFTTHSIAAVGGGTSVFAADIDGDGDTDVLSAFFASDRINWYENDGSQNFTSRTVTTVADGARAVFAADMDRDGDLDVLSASFNDGKVAWYENYPDHPEIDVWGNRTSISDGDMTPSRADYTDFGPSFTANATVSRTFHIVNNGGLSVSLTGSPAVTISGANASDFTVAVPPSSTVSPGGGVAAFTIVFNPSSSGIRSATVSIANNDLDENPFEFAIAGLGVDLPADFGDAPAPYPTTLVENGAGHNATGPKLGLVRDSESNGVHSLLADGDDNAGVLNDEDGVTFPASVSVGELSVQITVHVTDAPAGAKLDAWIDFNADGNWGDAHEHIASSVSVVNGDNLITFDVPSIAEDGATYARFRLSTAGNLAVQGTAADGEVEDYRLLLLPPAATKGVFSAPKLISTETDAPFILQTADLDSDGDLDIVATSLNDDRVTWYENDGAESFTPHTITANADWAWGVFTADMDDDGDLDVLSASNYDDKVAWYENDGTPADGFWMVHVISLQGDNNEAVYVADLDSDGDLDVLSPSCEDNTVAWHENNGAENFTRHIISSAERCAVGVEAADVDGDGDLDVLTAAYSDNRLAWYENDGTQNFSRHIVSTNAFSAVQLHAADLDNDGDMDLVSAEHGIDGAGTSADNKFVGYENDGAQNFTPYTIATLRGQPGVSDFGGLGVADVNGDGLLDVIVGSNAIFDWYKNDGTPAVGPWAAQSISMTTNASVAVAGDLDGDGDLDVVATSMSHDTVTWYENLPDGDFDNDGDYDCADVNALTTAVGTGGSVPKFDLNGDDLLSLADVDQWRVEAGNANLGAGRVYRVGDANLDGAVDVSDYNLWNAAKFTSNTNWCHGNFNADGVIDGTDFGLWNSNKFASANSSGRSARDIHMSLLAFPARPPAELTPACQWVIEVGVPESTRVDPTTSSDPTPLATHRGSTGIEYLLHDDQRWTPWRHRLADWHGMVNGEMADDSESAIDAVLEHWSA